MPPRCANRLNASAARERLGLRNLIGVHEVKTACARCSWASGLIFKGTSGRIYQREVERKPFIAANGLLVGIPAAPFLRRKNTGQFDARVQICETALS